MFGDLALLSDQISGQNTKSLNTFVSEMKDSDLSVGCCGPAPLYIRPIYLTQQQTSTVQTTPGQQIWPQVDTGFTVSCSLLLEHSPTIILFS